MVGKYRVFEHCGRKGPAPTSTPCRWDIRSYAVVKERCTSGAGAKGFHMVYQVFVNLFSVIDDFMYVLRCRNAGGGDLGPSNLALRTSRSGTVRILKKTPTMYFCISLHSFYPDVVPRVVFCSYKLLRSS